MLVGKDVRKLVPNGKKLTKEEIDRLINSSYQWAEFLYHLYQKSKNGVNHGANGKSRD